MYDALKAEAGLDSMDFIVTRGPEKQKPGQTFSAEALADLTAAIGTFIGARVVHHWEAKDGGYAAVGPSVIRAEVRLTIDDAHVEPSEERRPWYALRAIDVERR
jgi:hypothetical protein